MLHLFEIKNEARRVRARRDEPRFGRIGMAVARFGSRGPVWLGEAWQERNGKVRFVAVRQVMA